MTLRARGRSTISGHDPGPPQPKAAWSLRWSANAASWFVRRADGVGDEVSATSVEIDAPAVSDGRRLLVDGAVRVNGVTSLSPTSCAVDVLRFVRASQDALPGRSPDPDPQLEWCARWIEDCERWLVFRPAPAVAVFTPRLELDGRFVGVTRDGILRGWCEALLDGRTMTSNASSIERARRFIRLRSLKVYDVVMSLEIVSSE